MMTWQVETCSQCDINELVVCWLNTNGIWIGFTPTGMCQVKVIEQSGFMSLFERSQVFPDLSKVLIARIFNPEELSLSLQCLARCLKLNAHSKDVLVYLTLTLFGVLVMFHELLFLVSLFSSPSCPASWTLFLFITIYHVIIEDYFFKRIRKIAKSDCWLRRVLPSVRMEQLGSHWKDFDGTWYLSFLENLSSKLKFN